MSRYLPAILALLLAAVGLYLVFSESAAEKATRLRQEHEAYCRTGPWVDYEKECK